MLTKKSQQGMRDAEWEALNKISREKVYSPIIPGIRWRNALDRLEAKKKICYS